MIRILLAAILALASIMLAQIFPFPGPGRKNQTQSTGDWNYNHIKVAAVIYEPPSGLSATEAEWFSTKVDWFILPSQYGGIISDSSPGSPKLYNSKVKLLDYKDVSGHYVWEDTYAIIDWS
jgi:hypothetical protein